MTVQSRITIINTTPTSAGADSIEMGIKSLKIKPKNRNQKPDNPDEILNNYPAHSKCGEVPLLSRMTVPNTLSKKDLEPVNLDPTTTVKI
jgi:hypothetical protein